MRYQVIILLVCGIGKYSQISLSDNICNVRSLQRYVCCYNYEVVNGICTECQNGTTTVPGGRCLLCENDTYGHKCIKKCECDHFHRCDPMVGCILKTSMSKIVTTYAGPTEQAMLPNEKVIANETTTLNNTTVIRHGVSDANWIIYTLCITCCFFLTGFGHLYRTYRKRNALCFGKVKKEVTLNPSELPSYINDIYDEVDDNSLTFVTTESNIQSQTSQKETINFVFNDTQSSTGDEDDEFGYLDLYFATKVDENRPLEDRASQNESLSTSSSSSNVVVQDNREYTKPNITLQQYCQDNSHSSKVAVMVHHCIERSQGKDENDISNIYSNVCTPLQNDRQINNHDQSNEMQILPDSKTVHETTLQTASPSVSRSGYFQDHLNKYVYAASENIIADCGESDSVKDKICDKNIPKTL